MYKDMLYHVTLEDKIIRFKRRCVFRVLWWPLVITYYTSTYCTLYRHRHIYIHIELSFQSITKYMRLARGEIQCECTVYGKWFSTHDILCYAYQNVSNEHGKIHSRKLKSINHTMQARSKIYSSACSVRRRRWHQCKRQLDPAYSIRIKCNLQWLRSVWVSACVLLPGHSNEWSVDADKSGDRFFSCVVVFSLYQALTTWHR